MEVQKVLKIGNAQAFWGDSNWAAAQLLSQQPDLDYITLDYLSEVSLSIMAIQKSKDANAGYAQEFVEVIKSLIPFWQKGSKVKLITNAGGLDPIRCALACYEILRQAGCSKKIGVVTGDDVLGKILKNPEKQLYNNLESGESILNIHEKLSTANAYLGAKFISQAIERGAEIIITGRVADPSLTVAPCASHFGWSWSDYDYLAQATLAGHLIECGTQVTGGISTDWLHVPEVTSMGFPFVEINSKGDFVITKPESAGGRVTLETVKEQILYEIGDPNDYLSPDVTMSLLSVKLSEESKNRVYVKGAKGSPPPKTYKVSATYRDGFKAEGLLAIFGRQAGVKAYRAGEMILERVRHYGYTLERSLIECIGSGDVVLGVKENKNSLECMLRVCAADHRKEAMECFIQQFAPLVTSGPQGTTGYTTGRPHIRPIFGYWPCLIDVSDLAPQVEILEVVL